MATGLNIALMTAWLCAAMFGVVGVLYALLFVVFHGLIAIISTRVGP